MPPPIFPMCQNLEKNRVLIWPPSEMTKSRTCHPKIGQSPELTTPKLTRVGDSAIVLGRQVMDLVISEAGQFRTLFFSSSGFWDIGNIGGGKKDQPPCKYKLCYCVENTYVENSHNRHVALFSLYFTLKALPCLICSEFIVCPINPISSYPG